jgi:hypothetical protein
MLAVEVDKPVLAAQEVGGSVLHVHVWKRTMLHDDRRYFDRVSFLMERDQ